MTLVGWARRLVRAKGRFVFDDPALMVDHRHRRIEITFCSTATLLKLCVAMTHDEWTRLRDRVDGMIGHAR